MEHSYTHLNVYPTALQDIINQIIFVAFAIQHARLVICQLMNVLHAQLEPIYQILHAYLVALFIFLLILQ
jgi:hypothetical protein